jgi:hypothetical protein
MTTFTSEDREAAYKHDEPTHIVDSGASVMTLRDAIEQDTRLEMYREQIHAQQCEINALRTALIYARPTKELTDEEITEIYNEILIHDKKSSIKFARAILRKAQEK